MAEKLLLDVGGTYIKCSDGRSIPASSEASREEIVAGIKAIANGRTDLQLRVAMPGPFNYETGEFRMKHKFAAVFGENFADLAGVPRENCKYIHDVNCMLLGEISDGNGKEYSNVAMVALGTGLGFAMSVDGKILKNESGSPAVSIFDRPYKDGVLEDYASKRGVVNAYRRLVPSADPQIAPKDIGQLGFGGDKIAQQVFEGVGNIIAEAIAPILREYNIECLLFGGQISHNFPLMEAALRAGLEPAVPTLKKITTISDFDNATFNGLKFL